MINFPACHSEKHIVLNIVIYNVLSFEKIILHAIGKRRIKKRRIWLFTDDRLFIDSPTLSKGVTNTATISFTWRRSFCSDEQVRGAIYTSLPGDHAVRVKNHT